MNSEGVILDAEVRVTASARREVESQLAHWGWVMARIGNAEHSVGWAELRGGFAALAWMAGEWPHAQAPDHEEEPELERRFQALVIELAAHHIPDDEDDTDNTDE